MKESELLFHLKNNPFVLAPMAGITDLPFRSFMKELGTSIVITELVSANGLRYNSERTRRLMQFEEKQRPVGIQIFGEDLENLAIAAKEVEAMGADFVDLNFGCPVPKVVKKGAGSAVLRDLVQLRKVLQSVKGAVSIPVTIKIRTGWDESSRNAPEVARIAREEGITWVAIHGRTRAKGYSGQADWDYIKQVKDESPLPIIGNGDITTAQTANQRLKQSNCDGVMIGRGCLKNPWIFQQSLKLHQSSDEDGGIQVSDSYFKVIQNLQNHLENHCEERMVMLQLKKFSSWYSAGFPQSSKFRKGLFQIKEKQELTDRIYGYFEHLSLRHQKDTSSEPFLMGGHG